MPSAETAIAQAADRAAARHAFSAYRIGKAANTVSRQDDDLACFATYLGSVGIRPGKLSTEAEAWRPITHGLVAGYVRWMLAEGFSMGTVGVRLSTIKTYAALAAQAGAITTETLALIRAIRGYSRAEGRRIDEQRPLTRIGQKKSAPAPLTREQAMRLLAQPATPQGRRDAVMMGLLLTMGLRVGEICALQVSGVDLKAGTIRFFRPKVDKWQTHRMPRALLAAVRAYIQSGDAPAMGLLLRQSLKNGRLSRIGMTRSGVNKRVAELGAAVGVPELAPHDCRHYWATAAARNKTPVDRLQDAGGWSSPAMPLRYVESAKIANDGVVLGDEALNN